MKARKSRRGVSTIIAVLLMIIITVAAAVIVWAFLSGYIGARTAPSTQTSVIQINAIHVGAAGTGGATVDVQLVSAGSDPSIVAVYVNGVLDTATYPTTWTATTMGSTKTIDVALAIAVGNVVKVVCADGGAASATAV
jgi:FlaG/FlaF family flagellin (archaellin)